MSPSPSRFGERQLVALFQKQYAGQHPGVLVGIGDDAAVLRSGQGQMVCSVDVNVEGVHFDRRWLTLQDIGYRAMQAALSDLAAMGAQPVAVLCAWILPAGFGQEDCRSLAEGQQLASLDSNCPIVGGNVSKGRELSLTTTVLGNVTQSPVCRVGARPGDEVWLLGEVGCAAAGLSALRRWSVNEPEKLLQLGVRQCVAAWRRPRALVAQGQLLSQCATAALDISDGLAEDTRQLAEASGVRIVLEERLLACALSGFLRQAGKVLGKAPLHWALNGGEDYALLATGPGRARPRGARVIGRVRAGRGAFCRRRGRLQSLATGFDHLS